MAMLQTLYSGSYPANNTGKLYMPQSLYSQTPSQSIKIKNQEHVAQFWARAYLCVH